MLIKLSGIILTITLIFTSTASFGCVIKMGYKDGEKRPLIGDKDDNSGVYLDLYTTAAKQIGCELAVYRLSKKRLHQKLQHGYLDFYPGASFSQKRSGYLQYIKNGLITAEYGLTPLNFPDIDSYSRVKSLDMVWLMELGSSKQEISNKLRVKTHQANNVTIDKVMRYFESRNVSFYVADKELIDQFTFERPDYFLEYNGLQLHKNCCGGEQPMYLAFSKKSIHFQSVNNPNFDNSIVIAPNNQQSITKVKSVAYRFANALARLAEEGTTENIYQTHLTRD